ncbi:MAG: pyridoxamine 5'-phosphate oxidase family protein [Pseudomonadota bacterium]
MDVPKEIIQLVNKPGRVGVLGTADAQGRPNVAYFGSPRFWDDGSFVVALGQNRTLKNLEENPFAAFFCVEEAPVGMASQACRLYLKVKDIEKKGPRLDAAREMIAAHAGPAAAQMIKAAVTFEVIEIRPLLAPA